MYSVHHDSPGGGLGHAGNRRQVDDVTEMIDVEQAGPSEAPIAMASKITGQS